MACQAMGRAQHEGLSCMSLRLMHGRHGVYAVQAVGRQKGTGNKSKTKCKKVPAAKAHAYAECPSLRIPRGMRDTKEKRERERKSSSTPLQTP